MAAIIAAAIGAAGSLAGGAKGKKGSKSAAGQQQAALQQALQTYQGMYGDIKGNTQPWITGGQEAFGQAISQLPTLTKPFDMTEAGLEATPGYQFARNQGLKTIQNGFASKGLASSGAAMSGAGQFATGLADQTYGNQFNRYWDQNKNILNMLLAPSAQGLTANGQLVDAARGFAQMIGGAQTGMGNAGAAGTLGATGQAQNGLNGLFGNLQALFTPGANGQPAVDLFGSGAPATTGAGTSSDTSTFV